MNKDLVFIITGRIVVAIAGLLSLRILTTVLPPESYGELALLVSIQNFCGLLLVNPIGQYININTHRWYDEHLLFAKIEAYRWYLFVVAGIGAFAVVASLYNKSSSLLISAASLFSIVLAINWNNTLVPLLNMLGARRVSILWSIITVISGILFSTLFVILHTSATSWLFGQAVGMTIGSIGAKFSLNKLKSNSCLVKKVTLISRKEIISYCLPLALATGFMWINQSGYRFIVEYYWGLTELAFFTVGLQVSSAIWAIVETIVMQFLHPYFLRATTQNDQYNIVKQSYTDLLNVLIPVYILIAGFFVVSAPYLIVLLIDKKYNSALDFLIMGLGIEFCRVITNVFSNAAHIKRKTSSLTIPYAAGALIVVVGISIIGVRAYLVSYAAYMLLISVFIIMIIMAILMYRQIKYSLDIKKIFLSMLCFVALIVIGSFIPENVNFVSSILITFLLGTLTLFGIVIFLINNKALKRMLSHNLLGKL